MDWFRVQKALTALCTALTSFPSQGTNLLPFFCWHLRLHSLWKRWRKVWQRTPFSAFFYKQNLLNDPSGVERRNPNLEKVLHNFEAILYGAKKEAVCGLCLHVVTYWCDQLATVSRLAANLPYSRPTTCPLRAAQRNRGTFWSEVKLMCGFIHCSPCFKSETSPIERQGSNISTKKPLQLKLLTVFVHLMWVFRPFMSVPALFHLEKLFRKTVFFCFWLFFILHSSHTPAT